MSRACSAKRDLTLATLVAIVTLTFFVITLRPDVGGTEDSPKFQFVGRVLGTSHSPGYPFYVDGDVCVRPPADRHARLSHQPVLGGVRRALVPVHLPDRAPARRDALLSIAAALAAATSYPVWSNSVTAEVYTLAAVLSGFAVYWLIAFAQTGAVWRLYAACAMWACGFGNHLTIVGILPAAVIYGVVKDRSVLRPRVAITAAIIGILGVLQYGFIAIRTMQGAPYLEARADTIMGVFDVIIARDVSWARFYQAQSAVAAIEVPMLLNGIRIHMGTIRDRRSSAIAIVIGIKRRNAEVLLIFGAAGRHAGHDRQPLGRRRRLHHAGVRAAVAAGRARPAGAGHGRPTGQPARWQSTGQQAHGAAGPVRSRCCCRQRTSSAIDRAIEALRTPGEGPGVRALYAKLPARSALVAENYWLARLVNYMHFSGEVAPDPNPRVLDSDANDVKAAVADGLEVYAFEGATQWLNAQGLRFEKTDIARQPFETWLAAQPRGTLIVAASAGTRRCPSSGCRQRAARKAAAAPTTAHSRGPSAMPRPTVAQQDSLARSNAASAPKAAC